MMNRPYLVILITSWFLLELTLPEEEICPSLTNIKIDLYPALVNVTWDCNVTKPMEKCVYKIFLQKSVAEKLNVSACFFIYDILNHMAITIHDGLKASIKIYNDSYKNKVITTEEVIAMPEGKKNTAAENFSCVVYNVSIVNCSWIAGREAPKDTQYSLDFRYDDVKYISCDDYRRDSFGRQVGCIWKSPNISFSLDYYVQLVGSSKETSIRFFDTLLKLNNYVILDPPRNIRLNPTGSSELEITWEQPETYTQLLNKCFLYDININGEIKTDLKENSYKTHILPNRRFIVSMRVKWKSSCSGNKDHSRWSELVIYDPNSGSVRLTLPHVLIILGVVTAAILFIFIFLCHRFQVWKKLFPKVPKPKLKFLDQAEQKEFSGQNMSKMEHLHTIVDNEECICSQITEISKTTA